MPAKPTRRSARPPKKSQTYNEPRDKNLYDKVKREAKLKFDVWPSAYASGWLVREYKKRGGTYKNSIQGGSLTEWFSQNNGRGWTRCPEDNEKKTFKPCGRKSARNSNEKYPACRPRLSDCFSPQAKKAIKAKISNRTVKWKIRKIKGGRDMSYCKCSGPNKTPGFTCAQHCRSK